VRPARALTIVALLAVAALVVVGLVQLGGGPPAAAPSTLTLPEMQARLAGSPAPLAALHAQASELLPGGLRAVRARLDALHGLPLVVNKWASWCGPCQTEFPIFQRVSDSMGREVAFLGLDSGDSSRTDAAAFLRSHPVSYPSYFDPSGEAGTAITDSGFTPVTVFYEPDGSAFIRQGQYPSVAALERDVRRYALDG
jgi:cytochrome c biogenesis protein CcmG, thiol:disulfide interchange protein DsbE